MEAEGAKKLIYHYVIINIESFLNKTKIPPYDVST